MKMSYLYALLILMSALGVCVYYAGVLFALIGFVSAGLFLLFVLFSSPKRG